MHEPRLAAFLLHPITAWHTLLGAQTERADHAARDAGLTVEARPSGVRRYRDPALDRLAVRRAASKHTTVPDRAAVTTGQGWSAVRLVEAGSSS